MRPTRPDSYAMHARVRNRPGETAAGATTMRDDQRLGPLMQFVETDDPTVVRPFWLRVPACRRNCWHAVSRLADFVVNQTRNTSLTTGYLVFQLRQAVQHGVRPSHNWTGVADGGPCHASLISARYLPCSSNFTTEPLALHRGAGVSAVFS